MPLEHREEFIARLQRNNRVKIPVLIRWRQKLEHGEISRVHVQAVAFERQDFYARLKPERRSPYDA